MSRDSRCRSYSFAEKTNPTVDKTKIMTKTGEDTMTIEEKAELACSIVQGPSKLACNSSIAAYKDVKNTFTPTENNTTFLGLPQRSIRACTIEFEQNYPEHSISNIRYNSNSVSNDNLTSFECYGTDSQGNSVSTSASKTLSCQQTYDSTNTKILYSKENPVTEELKPGCYKSIARSAQ